MNISTEKTDEQWDAIGELRQRVLELEQWASLVSSEMSSNNASFSPKDEEKEDF